MIFMSASLILDVDTLKLWSSNLIDHQTALGGTFILSEIRQKEKG